MLFDDFKKTCIVETGELGEVVHIRNNVLKFKFGCSEFIIMRVFFAAQFVDFTCLCFDASVDLAEFDALKVVHLLKLFFKTFNEVGLVILGPVKTRLVFQQALEVVVG